MGEEGLHGLLESGGVRRGFQKAGGYIHLSGTLCVMIARDDVYGTVASGCRRNGILNRLPNHELALLLKHLVHVRLVADQVVIERGHAAEHVLFIESGIVCLVAATDPEKIGVQVAMIGREGMVGGLALLDGSSPAYASGIVRISGAALRISISELRRSFACCPVLRDLCLQSVQQLTRHIMAMAASYAESTLTRRFAQWLLMAHERVDGDDLPVTHEALSALLGVRRSGITVAAASLQQDGLIRTLRGRLRVLDRDGLNALAYNTRCADGALPGDANLRMEEESNDDDFRAP